MIGYKKSILERHSLSEEKMGKMFTNLQKTVVGSLHIWKDTINDERSAQVLEQHLRRVRVLNWLACSLDLSAIENIWHIMK
uniref:Uncharacterized protein n=1 Tax=Erpetoichthys calabaricus TaxID=27687 RepID=A0A8C4T217_ERPCA